MLKSKVPLGCLIQSSVNIEVWYSNYGLNPPMWIAKDTWLRVGVVDSTPVRGHRLSVLVDFYVEGVCTYDGIYDAETQTWSYPRINGRLTLQRALVHYDEISKVWNDGPRWLPILPHYWSEREAMGLIPPEKQEKLQSMKDFFWTLHNFDDAKMAGYYIGKL